MYYWGKPDTLVTWCEEKYVISNYISEFKNTLSNVVYFLIPLVFKENEYKQTNKCIILMGLGSIFFHGTSRYIFQLLDEIPMILVTSNLIRLFNGFNKKFENFTRITIGLYIFLRTYYIFLFLFTVHILYLLFLSFHTITKDKKSKEYLKKSVFCMGLGKILWDVEQNYCDSYNWIDNLHSFWHFLSAFSLFYIMKSHKEYYKIA